jgi:parallel beta-helix repeat protein
MLVLIIFWAITSYLSNFRPLNQIVCMMRYIIFVFLLSCTPQLKANRYFFSTTNGDDSRSVTEAQNPSTPWKSIAKLNELSSTLRAGDSVFFKKGDIFEGSITVARSGSSENPIVYTAYGDGPKPRVTGFATLKNWTLSADGTYTTLFPDFKGRVNMLLVDGVPQAIGRYPNIDAPNKGYLTIESVSGNNRITGKDLSSSPNWTDGEVVIRKARWVIDRNEITKQSGTTITYNSESPNDAAANFGYFIQNHPKTLDRIGEWYFSSKENKVGIFFGSQNPASSNIQVSSLDVLVAISNQSNIVFNNLDFAGSNVSTFEITGSNRIAVINCGIINSGTDAIKASNSSNLNFQNLDIEYTNNIAFNVTNSSNCSIKSNRIKNTGTVVGMGKGNSGSYEAIMIDGDNNLIENNVIDGTGYTPITFRGNSNVIANNFINNYGFVKDDGGGIYSWNNVPNASPTQGIKITNNIVLNGIGAGEGTDNLSYHAISGIYMDDNTANAEISGNSIASCGLHGIYLHNVHEIMVEKNVVFNNGSQIAVVEDRFAPASPVRNIRLSNNVFFSKESFQTVAEFMTDNNDISDFGVFDRNNYSRPTNDNFIINTSYYVNGVSNGKAIDLDGWKSLYGKDLLSTKSPVKFPSSDNIRFEYNETSQEKVISLDQNYIDVYNNSYSGSLTLQPYSSIVLIKQTSENNSNSLCANAGSISLELWNNVNGNTIASIPLDKTPDSKSELAVIEINNIGDHYASRMRGYLCPPQTGNYTFFIAGDDAAELWVSTDNNVANKKKIASLPSWTDFRQWDKFSSQKSAEVYLKKGEQYFLEVLQKEEGGNDNVSVAWRLPDGTMEAPIPGSRVSPFDKVSNGKSNQTISFNSIGNKTSGDGPFAINATASSGLPVSFVISSGPATLADNIITLTGLGSVEVQALQAGNEYFEAANSVTLDFLVAPPVVLIGSGTCSATGSISIERWYNVGGNDVSNIPLGINPSYSAQLNKLEIADVGDNYGTRIRGYLCPPQSGNYTFLIAGDDAVELWVSTDDNPSNKVRMANLLSWTNLHEWNKYASQKSSPVYLIAGHRYYVEVLHKQGGGGDHVSVAWQLPDGNMEAPILGSRLSPYTFQSQATSSFKNVLINFISPYGKAIVEDKVVAYPNPFITEQNIEISVSNSGQVKLDVIDIKGKLIKQLFKGSLETGSTRRLKLNTEGLLGGVYILRLTTETKVENQKIILLR